MRGNMTMWEAIPGVIVAVPLPQHWVPAVSCVMASQCISSVVRHGVQVIHSPLCKERRRSQSALSKPKLSSCPADTHRCLRMRTPAGRAPWVGSSRTWRACWRECSSRRSASGLRRTESRNRLVCLVIRTFRLQIVSIKKPSPIWCMLIN